MRYETSLQHHGVIGMKWGIRRYQNYDGSLKSLGKRRARLQNQNESLAKKISKSEASAQRKSVKAAKKEYKLNKEITSKLTGGKLKEGDTAKLQKASKKLKKLRVKSAKALKKVAKQRREIYRHEQIIKVMDKRYKELESREKEKGKKALSS